MLRTRCSGIGADGFGRWRVDRNCYGRRNFGDRSGGCSSGSTCRIRVSETACCTTVCSVSVERFALWQIEETAGFEAAWIRLDGLRMRAEGTVAGQLPEPYRLTYELETDDRAATTRLAVDCRTGKEQRQLDLRRDDTGWTVDGVPRPDLADALDCDLACCPVTNTMPVLRHQLHRQPGAPEFLMAFVEVPSLRVVPVAQAYRHLGLEPNGARVRYSSGSFTSDLLIDTDGLVVNYPTMAHRVDPAASVTSQERSSGAGSVRPGSV